MSGKRISSLLGKITIFVVICCCSLPVRGKYGGGTGEPNDPYLIYTAEQMNEIGLNEDDWDKHFLLCADIDLSDYKLPPYARNPNPADRATDVSIISDLSWTAGFCAISHDVYFGTSSTPPFIRNQTATIFDPGIMAYSTMYYWRIDEVSIEGKTIGTVWSFRTTGPGPTSPPSLPQPLMSIIDMSDFTETRFNIIGYYRSYSDKKPFIGVFDGNGHTISNFTYSSNGVNKIGLFGYVSGENAEIKNLGLIEAEVVAGTGSGVGSLVGSLSYGTITNCHSTGYVIGKSYVGGLVGGNSGTITNCYSTASVKGDNYIGGLVGGNSNYGTISDCYSTVSVIGNRYVGGLVGENEGTITNCYSMGSVGGDDNVGGLVGINREGTITNCYSTGDISGTRDVGGLVGNNSSGKITNCYAAGSVMGTTCVGGLVGWGGGGIYSSFWDIETSGQTASAGGKGKTTDEMQMANTFISWTVCGNERIWTLDEGNDYPHLWWEQKPGELLPSYKLSDFIAGNGTESDPYLIYTAYELNMVGLFSCDWDKHFKLMADIDLSFFAGTSFNIIGNDYDNPFTGVFDGNGHIISNFSNNRGLFGCVDDPNAEIKDLGLIDPNVDAGGWFVGSLVDYFGEGTITDCYVEGGNVSGSDEVGGLVGSVGYMFIYGYNDATGTITNCYSTCSVSGYAYVGGLVGYNTEGTISNCYSTGDVSGIGPVGGLAGSNYGTITNCEASGDVSGWGDRWTGGKKWFQGYI